jgi:hypothetical protein
VPSDAVRVSPRRWGAPGGNVDASPQSQGHTLTASPPGARTQIRSSRSDVRGTCLEGCPHRRPSRIQTGIGPQWHTALPEAWRVLLASRGSASMRAILGRAD